MWNKVKLGEIVEKVVDNRGKNPPIEKEGIPLIETSSISGNNKFPNLNAVQKFVSEATYSNWFRAGHPQTNDMLIITVGNGIGSVSIMPKIKASIAQNIVALRFDPQLYDGNFYYYYFSQNLIQDFLQSLDIGSAQPSLKVPHLLDLYVPVPSLEEQKSIAPILSSLDDKIDLLHRQNKTLEALAETLFRQWFVEEAGGETGNLGDIIELIYGKALKEEIRSGSGFPVVGSSGIVGYHSEFLVDGPGIVIGRKGTLGKVIYLFENFFPIDTTYFTKSKINSEGLFYEYFLLKTLNFEKMNTDSAVPGLNREIALSTEIKIPPFKRVKEYNSYCANLFKKLKHNNTQILTLTQIRDTLLPTLMSGEVKVKKSIQTNLHATI